MTAHMNRHASLPLVDGIEALIASDVGDVLAIDAVAGGDTEAATEAQRHCPRGSVRERELVRIGGVERYDLEGEVNRFASPFTLDQWSEVLVGVLNDTDRSPFVRWAAAVGLARLGERMPELANSIAELGELLLDTVPLSEVVPIRHPVDPLRHCSNAAVPTGWKVPGCGKIRLERSEQGD